MQIVIEISEDDYKEVKEDTYSGTSFENRVFSAIANGIPLPKGHGRLIDMKKLQKFVSDYTEHDAVQLIFADREDYLPTIIEADGGDAK